MLARICCRLPTNGIHIQDILKILSLQFSRLNVYLAVFQMTDDLRSAASLRFKISHCLTPRIDVSRLSFILVQISLMILFQAQFIIFFIVIYIALYEICLRYSTKLVFLVFKVGNRWCFFFYSLKKHVIVFFLLDEAS